MELPLSPPFLPPLCSPSPAFRSKEEALKRLLVPGVHAHGSMGKGREGGVLLAQPVASQVPGNKSMDPRLGTAAVDRF